MFKKIDKVFAAFGGKKKEESLSTEVSLENIKVNIEGTKIAASPDGQIIVAVEEIQGYKFLEVSVLSRTNIKSKRGSKLVLSSANNSFEILSDTQEIESNFFNQINCYVTRISFNITPKEISRIKKKDFEEVRLEYKKKALTFKKAR